MAENAGVLEKPSGADNPSTVIKGKLADDRAAASGKKRGSYRKREAPPPPAPVPLFRDADAIGLLRLPFETAYLATGCPVFPLTLEEESYLGPTAANVLNTWVQVDPKWLSLCLLGIGLASITSAKYIAYRAWLRERPQATPPPDTPGPAKSPMPSGGTGGEPAANKAPSPRLSPFPVGRAVA